MSKACSSGSSSEALPSAALIPPSAAAEWTAGRVELRDERDVRARVVGLDGRPHPGKAGADDEDIVRRTHGW